MALIEILAAVERLKDPWGNTYHSLVPGPGGLPFEITTYEADNQPGGEGENADISSAQLARTAAPR